MKKSDSHYNFWKAVMAGNAKRPADLSPNILAILAS